MMGIFKNESMSNTRTFNLERILTSLLGRTTLTILTQMVIAASLPLIYLYFLDIGFKIVTLLVQTGLGITSALLARLLLGKQSRSLQLSAALTAMIAGQAILNFISRGVLGLPFLHSEINGGPYWGQILQVFWSGVMTSLVIYAWNGKKKKSKTPFGVDDESKPGSERSNHHQRIVESAPIMNTYLASFSEEKNSPSIPKRDQLQKNELKVTNSNLVEFPERQAKNRKSPKDELQKVCPKPNSFDWIGQLSQKTQNKAREFLKKVNIKLPETKKDFTSLFSSVVLKNEKSKKARKKIRFSPKNNRNSDDHKIILTKRSRKVKLVGEEEHICPYCLEPVTRHDHRGMKRCPICKTWHHLDCWTEVGECQVPHYQK